MIKIAHGKSEAENAELCRILLNEVQLLAVMSDHPHIVQYKDSFLSSDQERLNVVMELLQGDTLHQHIR